MPNADFTTWTLDELREAESQTYDKLAEVDHLPESRRYLQLSKRQADLEAEISRRESTVNP